jgi:hypothetical protein
VLAGKEVTGAGPDRGVVFQSPALDHRGPGEVLVHADSHVERMWAHALPSAVIRVGRPSQPRPTIAPNLPRGRADGPGPGGGKRSPHSWPGGRGFRLYCRA